MCNKKPYAMPFGFKLRISFRKWLYPSIVIILCLLFLMISQNAFELMHTISNFSSNPTIMGLLGILLGSFISIASSLFLFSMQLNANALIKKRYEVYEPLFNYLTNIRKILDENSYLANAEFDFDYDDSDFPFIIKFAKLKKMKNDAKYLTIPKWLMVSLDQYMDDFREYRELFNNASNDAYIAVTEYLQKKKLDYPIEYFKNSFNYVFFDLLSNKYDLKEFRRYIISLDDDALLIELNELSKIVHTIESVSKMLSFFENVIIGKLDWIIMSISQIIIYINNNHEEKDPYL